MTTQIENRPRNEAFFPGNAVELRGGADRDNVYTYIRMYAYMYTLFVLGVRVYYVISNRNMYRGRGVDRIKARTVGPPRRAPEPAPARYPALCS